MLLPKTNTEQAHKVAERLRIYMENTNHPRIRAPITLSLGVASWPSADASIAQVMKQADAALYAAKAAGRNQVQSSPEVSSGSVGLWPYNQYDEHRVYEV